MRAKERILIQSPIGQQELDSKGSPVAVVHLDHDRSYAGIGELLQAYINNADQDAWNKIKAKITYTYESMDLALSSLEAEAGFAREVRARVAQGQKLLFKPNLVMIMNIDPQTHGPGAGSTTCTEWPFVAAAMRWFHDKLGITYHQMALGEAASSMPAAAGFCSRLQPDGQMVTVEAVIEGKCGSFYGGWGFYFVRQYLAETHDRSHEDDPMHGYEESIAGRHIPMGRATDKLMVYDLNRIHDDPSKGRDIPVPDGINFQSITLHKAVVGGDPADPEDRRAYPGCVLINVPKLKVHAQALFTNVIKNLGIGLYPMQSTKGGDGQWEYAVPHHAIPGIKGGVPHQVWFADMDEETSLPKRDEAGNYVVTKTGGMPGTMADIIKAVTDQGIFSLHIVDAIEAINLNHTGLMPGVRIPEGLVFAGVDPVATDFLCARYVFSNVPLEEARKVDLLDGFGGHFIQRVTVPTVEGPNVVSRSGYDCPLSRDISFAYAEKRGVGQRRYYVVGYDATSSSPLVSLQGHLGLVRDGVFGDLKTKTLYFDAGKIAWDQQKMTFAYLEAVDQLTGSTLKKEFMAAFDEDEDGVVGYEEFGKKGIFGPGLYLLALRISWMGTDSFAELRGAFSGVVMLRCSNSTWNAEGHDLFRESVIGSTCLAAYNMSQLGIEGQDPFLPSLTWGKGKWPSFQLASHIVLGTRLYGPGFPLKVGLLGLYGLAFRYADLTQNGGGHSGGDGNQPDPEAAARYVAGVLEGKVRPLDFTLYVVPGYGSIGGVKVPNVEETTDPAKIFTASFRDGAEIWPVTKANPTSVGPESIFTGVTRKAI